MSVYVTPVARSVPFDNDTNGYIATDTQAAIEETATQSGQSRYAVIIGYNGNANSIKYLEVFSSNPSNTSPFIVSEPGTIESLGISASSSSTGTVTIYKNAVASGTVSLTAQTSNSTIITPVTVAAGDKISAAVTSGSASNPVLSVLIKVAF